ncbi:MAG: dystroglycan-type cadherin-like protein, partial [Gammaproteobacteria bacterium]|nr:dystroglycan-type cadherin-like protein [Gammaproteobacteria bacterium]
MAVDDVDSGEAIFVTQTDSEGDYGNFSITFEGEWSYQLDISNLDVQVLPEGETLTDSFTVNSFDGTGSQVVEITITGING